MHHLPRDNTDRLSHCHENSQRHVVSEMGTSQSIGVVIVEIEGKEHAYSGTLRSDNQRTFDELQDAVWVAERGARFPLEAARVLMPENTIRFQEEHHLL